MLHVVGANPEQFAVLAKIGLAFRIAKATAKRDQLNREGLVMMNYGREGIVHDDSGGEFFPDFPDQRLAGGFARLDFSAWELPEVPLRFFGWAPRGQKESIALDERADDGDDNLRHDSQTRETAGREKKIPKARFVYDREKAGQGRFDAFGWRSIRNGFAVRRNLPTGRWRGHGGFEAWASDVRRVSAEQILQESDRAA